MSGKMFMRLASMLACSGSFALVSACGSAERDAARAQERAYEAQERVAEQRLELVEKYQDCVEDAGGNQAKAAACESYLKAADALK
jgi:hypothetical protein